MSFRYNKSNMPTLYRTNVHAPCKVCGCHGACESNYVRTVYLCRGTASDNPMPQLDGWVHVLDCPSNAPGIWTRFLEPCKRFSNPALSTRLAGALGVDVRDLALYPFEIDPVHHHGVLPAMAADRTPEGVYMCRNEGPEKGKMFMLRYSKASPVFPVVPASGGRRLYCMASITDAVQAQAAGFDTAFNGSQCPSDAATQHLVDYALACNAPELVMVADSRAGEAELEHLTEMCRLSHDLSGGLRTSLAQVPSSFGDFDSWRASAGFGTWSHLPDERLVAGEW